jgi:transcriptional regulator with XRE-family HTH domain
MMAKTTKQPDTVDIDVGQRIKLQRQARRMSQENLGDALGVTFQQIQKYEKGVNRVGAGRLTKIADALNVPVSAFFGSTGTHGQEGATIMPLEHLTVPGAQRLVEAYARIQRSDLRQAIVKLVEKMGREKSD